MKSKLYLALLIASLAANAAPLPLEVVIRADNTKTLPGIPVDVRLILTNRSASEIALESEHVMFRAQRAGQPAFWVFDGTKKNGGVAFYLPDCSHESDEGFTVPARRSMEYAINGNPDGSKSWWDDPRLNVPGVYRLQLVLNPPEWAQGNHVRPAEATSDSDLGPQALISNALTIVVEEPHGNDAIVWNALSNAVDEDARGSYAVHRADPALARRLLDSYPESAYAPWLAFRLIERSADLEARETYRKRYGVSPLTEVLEMAALKARSDGIAKLGLKANAHDTASMQSEMRNFLKSARHPFVRCSMGDTIQSFSRAVERDPQNTDDHQRLQRRQKDHGSW
jgi:hypothetical protein